jgi:hypothetical protein
MMFYKLMLLGSVLVMLGLVNRRIQRTAAPSQDLVQAEAGTSAGSSALDEMNGRLERLENLLFQSLVSREEMKAEASEEAGEAAAPEKPASPEEQPIKKQPMPDSVKAVLEYESQGLSLQEIANITRMDKGEVLLLKNLSKHYSR